MELLGEIDGLNVSPDQISRERTKLSACVRQVRVAQLPNQDSTSLHRGFHTAKIRSHFLQSVISCVQTVQQLWMSRVIKPVRPKQKVERAQGNRDIGEAGIDKLVPFWGGLDST